VAEAELGVIGISGYSAPFDEADSIELETPYGNPSAPMGIAEIGGKKVAFLTRRGGPRRRSRPTRSPTGPTSGR
jgi:5'-methylthioadenosine phosphorylase